MHEGYKEDAVKRVLEVLRLKSYQKISDLSATAYITKEPVPFAERERGERKRVEIGASWGGLWDCAWFQFTGRVPEAAAYDALILCLDVSGEGLVVNREGDPVQGITTAQSTFDVRLGRPEKKYVQLSKVGIFQEEIEVWADCGCNDLFGAYTDSGRLRQAELAVVRESVRQLYYDMCYLWNLCTCIQDGSYKQRIRNALYQCAVHLLEDACSDASAADAIRQLSRYLSVDSRYAEDFKLDCIGHAHIDLAWLWPIRETKRKAARTFATALAMFEEYPDYIFGASQPQMFAWIKEEHPALYKRVQQAVAAGRMECQGGMWVEPDTNLSGGEALIRQFLYGKQFFMEEFSQDMEILWLPDVFGYSAALPQIMKHAEIAYFMTIKLSWNEHNVFPYHTFYWKGIDGSRILSHMPPEGTYNSAALPESYQKAVDQYQERAISDKALMLFGIGDGGGGPGESHLENLKRAASSVGVPVVRQRKAIDFFRDLQQDPAPYPEWRGELYLEKHQGTYTTHARNKKDNRKMEILLRESEFACTFAERYAGFPYPHEKIKALWKEALLYQFHDILPGSSIQRVYEESQARYAGMKKEAEELLHRAYQALASVTDTRGIARPAITFNSLSFARQEKGICIPPMGFVVHEKDVVEEGASSVSVRLTEAGIYQLENASARVQFAEDGTISSYYDKQEGRELARPGQPMNQYAFYMDDGDCWDIPFGYRDLAFQKPVLLQTQEIKNGISQRYAYRQSAFTTDITLADSGSLLTFQMQVDWQEEKTMFRTKFPVDIETEQASCEIQFGHIRRPTHTNTSWDRAKFEVPAHKWVDLSENGYGAALLNDCKYGHTLWENALELNILRSPAYPSKEEKGMHTLQYGFYPHQNTLAEADVIKQGYFFNMPSYTYDAGGQKAEAVLLQEESFIRTEPEGIVVEAVKKAEDGQGFLIRLYESHGKKTNCRLYVRDAVKVLESNALERDLGEIAAENGWISLTFSAFEIKSLKVC